MTQAGKVAEIFTVAGEAFSKLGTLAMSLQPSSDRPQEAIKWGEEEIEMLRNAVKQFGSDVEKISDRIKTKSASQIKAALKQKAVAGTTIKANTVTTTTATLMAIPRSQFTIQGNLQVPSNIRQIGQKNKAVTPLQIAAIRGVAPISTQIALAPKKIKLDSGSLDVLTSTTSTLNSLIRQNTAVVRPNAAAVGNTIGLPIMASNQGFQVLMPSQQKATVNGAGSTVIPVSLLQTEIVRVSNANTAGNVDVES